MISCIWREGDNMIMSGTDKQTRQTKQRLRKAKNMRLVKVPSEK